MTIRGLFFQEKCQIYDYLSYSVAMNGQLASFLPPYAASRLTDQARDPIHHLSKAVPTNGLCADLSPHNPAVQNHPHMDPLLSDPSFPVLLILLPHTSLCIPQKLLYAIHDVVHTHDQRAQVICTHAAHPSQATTIQVTGDWACTPELLWRALTHLYTDYQ